MNVQLVPRLRHARPAPLLFMAILATLQIVVLQDFVDARDAFSAGGRRKLAQEDDDFSVSGGLTEAITNLFLLAASGKARIDAAIAGMFPHVTPGRIQLHEHHLSMLCQHQVLC